MADAMEMMILSILAPQLHCEWRLPSWQVALLTSVGGLAAHRLPTLPPYPLCPVGWSPATSRARQKRAKLPQLAFYWSDDHHDLKQPGEDRAYFGLQTLATAIYHCVSQGRSSKWEHGGRS